MCVCVCVCVFFAWDPSTPFTPNPHPHYATLDNPTNYKDNNAKEEKTKETIQQVIVTFFEYRYLKTDHFEKKNGHGWWAIQKY